MSKLADIKALVALSASVVIATSWALHAQTSGHLGDRKVSAESAAAAEARDPLRFAAALAMDGVPAGFVVGAGPRQDWLPSNAPEAAAPTTLSHALERFLRNHPDYILLDDALGAVVVRPRQSTICESALRHTLNGSPMIGPAYEVFWRLARLSNPSEVPAAPTGVVCGGNCDAGDPVNNRTMVTLAPSGMLLQEALSRTVNQAGGLVWVLQEQVSESNLRTCHFSYFDGKHHMSTSYVLARGRAGR
jgi:hypothetical protein